MFPPRVTGGRFPWPPFFLGHKRRHALTCLLWPCRKDSEYKIVVPQFYAHRAVEPLFNEDGVVSQDSARLVFFELEPIVLETDSEVIRNFSRTLDREDCIRISCFGFRERPVRVAFLRGDDTELRIEPRNENFFQKKCLRHQSSICPRAAAPSRADPGAS